MKSRFVRASVLFILLIFIAVPDPTVLSRQTERASINLGPSYIEASAGSVVNYAVTVGAIGDFSSLAVLVSIPPGLTVEQVHSCGDICGSIFQKTEGDRENIEVQLPRLEDGDRITFSFAVRVAPNAEVGSTFNLVAYLIGGPNPGGSDTTAFATLTVVEGLGSSSGLDNREVWIETSANALFMSEDSSATLFVNAGSWGQWNEPPLVHLVIKVPAGLRLEGDAIRCGNLAAPDAMSAEACERVQMSQSPLRTMLSIKPGLSETGTMTWVRLDFLAEDLSEYKTIEIEGILNDPTFEGSIHPRSIAVFAMPDHLDYQENTSVYAIEWESEFRGNASYCVVGQPVEVDVWEPGLRSVRWSAVTTAFHGFIAQSTRLPDNLSCFILIEIEHDHDVDPGVLTLHSSMTPPCRSCVLGPFIPLPNVIQVLPVTYGAVRPG